MAKKVTAKAPTNTEIKNQVRDSLVKAFQALLARPARVPGAWNTREDSELASRLSRAYEAIYKNNTSLHGLAERG